MNKSSSHEMLSLLIVKTSAVEVAYQLAFAKGSGRTFYWSATTQSDRDLIAKLEPGKRYWIRVASDQYGTQHWQSATEIDNQPRPVTDPITKKLGKTKAKPKINKELLEGLLF